MKTRPLAILLLTWFAVIATVGIGFSTAQEKAEPPLKLLDQLPPLGGGAGFGGPGDVALTGEYQVAEGGRDGVLRIKAVVDPGWHIYSVTQKSGGPQASQLVVAPSEQFELTGAFQADKAPQIKNFPFYDVPVEEHSGQVVWTAPLRLKGDADPQRLSIQVQYNGQVCEDSGVCKPIADRPVEVRFAGFYQPAAPAAAASAPGAATAAGSFRAERSHATITGEIEPQQVAPGGTVSVRLTATPDSGGWHVYAWAERDPELVSKPTLIAWREKPDWPVSTPAASAEPVRHETPIEEEPVTFYHGEPVTWTVRLTVPADTPPGDYSLVGAIGYQTCTDLMCDRQTGAQFTARVTVAAEPAAGAVPLSFSPETYENVARLAAGIELAGGDQATPPAAGAAIDFWQEVFVKLKFAETEQGWTHPWLGASVISRGQLVVLSVVMTLLASMVGGLVLNVMPCVLPVIGLKIMSFMQQAGESRLRIFTLNVWYALGLLSVFMVFATVAAVLHVLGKTFAWGEHLGDPRFAVPLLSLVFVLGLSMFGVWEIPIPGFVGSGRANELAAKEGPFGAFFKGVLTTILATPCSGPFIGLAVGIAVIAPLWLNYSIFLAMGLGMAAPYLLIGAFPRLIKSLPKPGEWMDGLKQFMGFLLMGTAVWIIYFLEEAYVIPALALMVGLGLVCWYLGRTPITAELATKAKRWVLAVGVGALSLLVFAWLLPPGDDSPELPWEKFTRATLNDRLESGNTVLVDFTADW